MKLILGGTKMEMSSKDNTTNPSISCSVNECNYNSSSYCTLNKIQVSKEKRNATCSEETICASFEIK